jgi:hypothetical protein
MAKISNEVVKTVNRCGNIVYKLNGKLHRDNDLPAVEWVDGDKEWYQNGQRHRDNDLPAYERADGSKAWWQNGLRHREDGPAIEWANGRKEYWLDGKEYTYEAFCLLEFLKGID